MRTALFALALALCLALPAETTATPLTGPVKYGSGRDSGSKRRVSGTMNYGGPRENDSVHERGASYEGGAYDSDYVRGRPRKVGRYIGPLPPGAQNATTGQPIPPQGPRTVGRYLGPPPPGAQNATVSQPARQPAATQGPSRAVRYIGPLPRDAKPQ